MAITPKNPSNPAVPNDLTEQAAGSPAIPNNLTEQAVGSPAIPNDLTEQAAGSPAIPNNLTELAVGVPAIPVNLTEQAVSSPAIPNNLTELSAGVPAIPNNLTELVVGSPAIPNDLTELSAGVPAIPNNLTEQAVGSPAIPNVLSYEPTTNRVLYSEQFDNGNWNKLRLDVTADTVTAPDGTATGDAVLCNLTSTGGMNVNQSVAISANSVATGSVYFKRGDQGFALLVMSDSAATNGVRQWFNLDGLAIGSGDTFGTGWSLINAHISPAANGWMRCSVTFQATGSDARMNAYPSVPADLDYDCTTGVTAGSVWGAQIEEGYLTSYLKTVAVAPLTEGQLLIPNDLTEQALPSVPRTLTPALDFNFASGNYMLNGSPVELDAAVKYVRNSSASFWNRVEHNGSHEYYLDSDHVGSVTNLALHSENFLDVVWQKTAVDVTEFGRSADSGAKAFKIKTDGGSTFPNIMQTVSGSGQYTLSFETKDVDSGYCVIYINGTGIGASAATSAGYAFDYNEDKFRFFSGVNEHNVSSMPLGDGWYRITLHISASTTLTSIRIYPRWSNSEIVSIVATRCQFTQSALPEPYVKTTGSSANETFTERLRMEYDPVTGRGKGVLCETSVTNHQIESMIPDSTALNGWGTPTGSTLLYALLERPFIDRMHCAGHFKESGVNSQHHVGGVSFTPSASTRYCFSVYVKPNTFMTQRYFGLWLPASASWANNVYATFDLVNGTFITNGLEDDAGMVKVGNSEYRCWLTATTDSTTTNTRQGYMYINQTYNASGVETYTGNTASGFYVRNAQMENANAPSSYIHTELSSSSRAHDDLQANTNFSANEVTVFAEFDTYGLGLANTNGVIEIGTSTTGLDLRIANNHEMNVYDDGSLLIATAGDKYMPPVSNGRVVFTMNSAESKLYSGGDVYAGSGRPYVSSGTANIEIGWHDGSASRSLHGNMSRLVLFNKALSSSEVSYL